MAKIHTISEPTYTVQEKINRQASPIVYTINGNGCHICISHSQARGGYPRLKRGGKYLRMSRYAWSLANEKPVPEGMMILHSCDNPNCINPDHLNPGTHQENMADRAAKGHTAHGSRHGKAKLTDDQVYYIRFHSKESVPELAKKYHVDETTIRKIKNGKTYPDVTIDSCPDLKKTAV